MIQEIEEASPQPKRLMSLKELPLYYGATKWFWQNLIWSRRLPAVKVGRKQFVDGLDVEEFINTNKKLQ